MLEDDERRRRDRRIPRSALNKYSHSPFMCLFLSGNDQALLNATGHDHSSFRKLLVVFEPLYDTFTWDHQFRYIRRKKIDPISGKPKGGKKRDMTACGCLGLVLMWYRTRGSCARGLSMIFGQTSSPLYLWLKFGRKVLLHILCRQPEAKVCSPSNDEVAFYTHVIGEKYPSCSDVWAAADGLKLLIQEPTDNAKQNQLFNGWKHSHNINCIFVFSPDGKIRFCLLNAPGTFHDSTMADYGIYEGMEEIYLRTGAKVVVDSAFKIGNKSYVVKSSQQDPQHAQDLIRNRDATSIRQLSEWGMRMIGGSFPRLKDSLTYEEEGDRMIILRLMVHLYNFQTSQVGINQIMNTFCERNNYFGAQYNIADDANFMF